MKRLLFILVVALLVSPAFAAAPAEEETVTGISILSTMTQSNPQMAYAYSKWKQDYPDAELTLISLDIAEGSTMTLDALNASGDPPNIFVDWCGRVGKYLIPGYALPLRDQIRDIDQYYDSFLAPYTIDGELLGLPLNGGAQAMLINLDIMDEIGFTVEDDWTVDDFLEMCELVKQHYGGEKFGTGIYAANQSGDYVWSNWFDAFGAKFFLDGDYSKSTIVETGGEKVHEFFQTLARNEYIPPNAFALRDYDVFVMLGRGEIAAMTFYDVWIDTYQGVAAEQGIEGGFRFKFVPVPNAVGKTTASYISTAAAMVIKTGTAADAMAARFVEYLLDPTSQTISAGAGTIPNRRGVSVLNPRPGTVDIMAILAANGVYDVGLTQEWFAAVRPLHFPILQKVLRLEIDPADSIQEYADNVNTVLDEW